MLRLLRQTLAVLLASATIGAVDANAIDGTWTGLGAEWSTGTKWRFGPAVSDTATFQHHRGRTPLTFSNRTSLNTVLFDAAAPAYSCIADSSGNAARCGNRGVPQFLASIMAAGIPSANRAMTAFFRAKAPGVSGNTPHAGGTTRSAGALQLGNDGATGSIPGDVLGNGVFAIAQSDTCILGGAISGTGRAILHAMEMNHG